MKSVLRDLGLSAALRSALIDMGVLAIGFAWYVRSRPKTSRVTESLSGAGFVFGVLALLLLLLLV